MSTTMAPLDTIRQYRLLRLKRRSDSRKLSSLRTRGGGVAPGQNGEQEAASKQTVLDPTAGDSMLKNNKASGETQKDNQTRASRIGNKKNVKENATDLFPTPPPPGDVFSHLLDPFAFLHKSTTTSSALATTPAAAVTSAAAPDISTSTTTTPNPPISTTTPPPAPPPPPPSVLTTPSSTSIATTLSTSIDTPLTTSIPPALPATTIETPATSAPDVPPAVTSALSSAASVHTSSASLPYPLDTTSQPRNGYNPDAYSTFVTSSITVGPGSTLVSSTTTLQTASGSAITSQVQPGGASHQTNDRNGSLSPTAAHVLIAAGTIGAFIMIVTATYFILRARNIDLFSVFHNREFRKGDNGWFGWFKKDTGPIDGPPTADIFAYSPDSFPEDRKLAIPQQTTRRPFSPLIVSRVDVPRTTRSPLLAGSQPPRLTRRPTIVDATLFEASRTQGVSRQPTQNTVKEAYTLASTHINNTYDTNRASLSRNDSNAYGPARRELSRMSEQSSLSSGFGDGQIIIPNSPPKPPAARMYPTKNGQVRNFSWVNSIFQSKPLDNRDTIYTTSSEETTGRYRTVNSWVAQQTRHVEKRQRSDRDAPSLPQPPLPR